jgi:hypothetical protein
MVYWYTISLGMQTATYTDSELTSVHVNLPTLLWSSVVALSRHLATTKTNVVVRALDHHAYFTRVLLDDPSSRIVVEYSDGRREDVSFPELRR